MQGRFTHIETSIFFQDELWSSFMDCAIAKIHENDGLRVFTIRDRSKDCYRSEREVIYYTSTSEAKCSCKLFELEGIPCHHILVALNGDFLKEIPHALILNRWTKTATRKPVFDDNGTLLEECAKAKNKVQLVTTAWGSFFEMMHYAEQSEEDLNMVIEVCNNMKKKLSVSGEKTVSRTKDLESFVGCSLPKEVEIHPPKPSSTKGSGKRIKGGKEMAIERKKNEQDIAKFAAELIMIVETALQSIRIMCHNHW